MVDRTDDPNDLDSGAGGVSRRGFLGSVLPAAVGVAVAQEALSAPAQAAPMVQFPAAEPSKLTLVVNGRTHKVLVEPRDTLLVVLREKLGLTGTKPGCERGECGACSVLIDGVPRYSCLTLALEAEGKEVTTVEGLMNGEELGPVQKAFVEEDAFQCGYCTPGQVDGGRGAPPREPRPDARRDPARHERQPLPLRDLRPHLQGGRQGRRRCGRGGDP